MATSAELRRFRLRNSTWMGGGVIIGPILQTLTSSVSSATVGVALNATISGKTAGSVLSLTGAGAAGVTASGNTVSGTPTATGDINVVETLTGATGSPKTTSALITVAAAAATVPAAMAAPTLTAGDGQITVARAAAPNDGGSPITSYDARRSTDGTTWTTTTGLLASQAITGLTNGTAYQIQTRAVNAVGAGAWSPSATATPVAAAAAQTIALSAPIITIGPSIQNVVNTRAPRMHSEAAGVAHLYPTPGTNQATGAASVLSTGAGGQNGNSNYYTHPERIELVMGQLGDPTKRGKCVVRYDPGPNDDFAVAPTGLINAMDAYIARVKAAGHQIQLLPVAMADQFATDAAKKANRDAFNTAMSQRHDPPNGVFYCGGRLTSQFETQHATLTYDGLHPNWAGAKIVGEADEAGLKPHYAPGSIFTDAASYVAPFGQAANAKGAFGGTGGTAGLGASGVVADGWSVFANTAGTAAGTANGVSAVASKGANTTLTINGKTIVVTPQIIRITGTPTSAGFVTLIGTFIRGTGAAQYFNAGEFAQASTLYEFFGANPGEAPVGMYSFGITFGLLGQAMNKVVDANTGASKAASGLRGQRTVPVQSLKLNGGQNVDISFGYTSGNPVDVTLIVYQVTAEMVETVAYAAPLNLSRAFPGTTNNNPLSRRPALTGTTTVGQTVTLNPPCISGGGIPAQTFKIKDADQNVITTKANTANPMTYALTSAEANKVIRMTAEAPTNGYGAMNVDDGPTYTVNP